MSATKLPKANPPPAEGDETAPSAETSLAKPEPADAAQVDVSNAPPSSVVGRGPESLSKWEETANSIEFEIQGRTVTAAQMWWWASNLHRSGAMLKAFPNAESMLLAIRYGADLGLNETQALKFCRIVEGNPTIIAEGTMAVIYGRCREELEEFSCNFVGELTFGDQPSLADYPNDYKCVTRIKRRDFEAFEVEFSVADAKILGRWGNEKTAWAKNPKPMLKNRSLQPCARLAFPDILGGFYHPDEMADVTDRESFNAETLRNPGGSRSDLLASRLSGGGGKASEQPVASGQEAGSNDTAEVIVVDGVEISSRKPTDSDTN